MSFVEPPPALANALHSEHVGQGQARQTECPDPEELATAQAVAGLVMAAEEVEHGRPRKARITG